MAASCARAAAVALSTGESREDESLGARLLPTFSTSSDENGTDKFRPADLIVELAKVEESPVGRLVRQDDFAAGAREAAEAVPNQDDAGLGRRREAPRLQGSSSSRTHGLAY